MNGGGGRQRSDIPARIVAVRWLEGETFLSISFDYDCAGSTIRRRVEEARILHPELDWDRPRVVKPTDNFDEYVSMNDGKPGQRDTPTGSIIPGRKQRLRSK